MKKVPKEIELSSLPRFVDKTKRETRISLAGKDKNLIIEEFNKFIEFMIKNRVNYVIKE